MTEVTLFAASDDSNLSITADNFGDILSQVRMGQKRLNGIWQALAVFTLNYGAPNEGSENQLENVERAKPMIAALVEAVGGSGTLRRNSLVMWYKNFSPYRIKATKDTVKVNNSHPNSDDFTPFNLAKAAETNWWETTKEADIDTLLTKNDLMQQVIRFDKLIANKMSEGKISEEATPFAEKILEAIRAVA